ncbi:hypothetical protein GCM10029963_04360 [Micromonospora andamanensis]|uniref:hypothetical protein n=1 Tax=Micromonospora andamanensis TaxID=1287068 RepID=UPI00194F0B46|nr:hypothetical protein [Micromonospora andamanensis]GIJ39949.1 hypothetical protein Vwe01_32740 [Micromonospora andamanensis]
MVDADQQRRSTVATVLARALPGTAPDVPLAMAREILDVLPDLRLLDDARAAQAVMEQTIERVQVELDSSPWAVELPPPGTTLSEALRAEARLLRRTTATKTGAYAIGFTAGFDAFVRALEARATTVDPQPRPGVATDSSAPAAPDDRPNNVRLAVSSRVAGLPADPAAREEYRRILIGNELVRYGLNTGVNSTEMASAVADLVLAALPEIDTLPEARDTLQAREEELLALWHRLAVAQAECGLTAAETRWRNALARELRQQADTVTPNAGMTDSFTIGFSLASQSLARKLRARADEIAVLPVPSDPWALPQRHDEPDS